MYNIYTIYYNIYASSIQSLTCHESSNILNGYLPLQGMWLLASDIEAFLIEGFSSLLFSLKYAGIFI